MQILDSIKDLPHYDRISVIINCGTRWVTSLAVVSALKNGGSPLLLIDCESQDGSFEHFRWMAERFSLEFYWLEWPLRSHGETLDRLFLSATSKEILLVDSDVEIPASKLLHLYSALLDDDSDAYGSGFIHGPDTLDWRHGLPPGIANYAERMWIPLVLLRVAPIRLAILKGNSFCASKKFLEVKGNPYVSWLIGQRFWIPGLRHISPRCTPAFTQFDTGGNIHAHLLAKGYHLARLEPSLQASVLHFHGVTRALRSGIFRRFLRAIGFLSNAKNETSGNAILTVVRERLLSYGVDI